MVNLNVAVVRMSKNRKLQTSKIMISAIFFFCIIVQYLIIPLYYLIIEQFVHCFHVQVPLILYLYFILVNNVRFSFLFLFSQMAADTLVIIICSVLVRDTYVIPRHDNGDTLIVPPNSADTTISSNGYVYVKFNDNEFYPMYFVYYERRPEHTKKSKFYRVNNRRNRYEPYKRHLHYTDDDF